MTDAVDVAIAAVSQRQHGNVNRKQLHALGLDDNAIAYRVRIGRLIRLYRGVYAVGHPPTTVLARAAAAVLACGERAALSHDAAVSLWGWRRYWHGPFEVTARSRCERPGLRVHVSRRLERRDVRTQLGIRVTSPARTVLDVAPRLATRRRITRLIDTARDANHLRLAALADVVTRFPRHPGAKLLRPIVELPAGPTRSELEAVFQELLAAHGLPQAEMNVLVGGHLVDALFRAERVVVELDGYGFHWSQDSFERDRERDADLLDRFGLLTVRLTWERMTERPLQEARRLERILAARR